MKRKIRQNYHWIIAVVLFIELAIYGGLANNGSLFILPVTEGLGISRGDFALAGSSRSLVSFVVTLISGVFVTRLGNRRMMISGLALGVFACTIAALSQNITYIIVYSILMGISDAFCSTTTATRVVSDWFHRYQGAVLGIVSSATGLGGSLVCIFLTGSISGNGFRGGYIASGIIILLAGILVVLFVRSRPSDMGLNPYGFGYLEKSKNKAAKDSHWYGYSMQDLIRRPIFYLMLLLTFLSSTCIYLMFSVIVPHVQDCGLSAADATAIQSTMLLMMTGTKILCGALSDRIGSTRVTVLCMAFAAISLWMMGGVTNAGSAWIATILHTIALPLAAITPPLLTGTLFGYQAYGKIIGIVLAMTSLGNLIAAPISNAVYDVHGSYSPVFRVGAMVAVAATGLYLLLFTMAKKDRKKYDAQTVQ